MTTTGSKPTRPLLDRPIPEIDRLLVQLRKATSDLKRELEKAVMATMIRNRVARYQARLATGDVVHVRLSLPEPTVRVNFATSEAALIAREREREKREQKAQLGSENPETFSTNSPNPKAEKHEP